MSVSTLASGVVSLLQVAYITSACLQRPAYPFLWVAFALCAGLWWLLFLPPSTLWRRFSIEFQVLNLTFAWLGDAVEVYAVAFCACTLLVYCLHVASAFLRYDPSSGSFLVGRCAAYGLLRALTHVLVRETPFPAFLEPLVPYALATLETTGMLLFESRSSYVFSVHDPRFVLYATLKSQIFLLLPLLEDTLLHRRIRLF